MRRLLLRVSGLVTMLGLFSAHLLAAEKADRIVLVADSRKFYGWRAWWANLYNEGHLAFALITVICIPLAGAILGILADLVMSRLGIDLRKRVLAEH